MNAKTASTPQTILIVTGVSGAGKTTVLKSLEDLGWEAVDNFPNRPITIIIPFTAGGSSDLTARRVGDAMGKILKQL